MLNLTSLFNKNIEYTINNGESIIKYTPCNNGLMIDNAKNKKSQKMSEKMENQ